MSYALVVGEALVDVVMAADGSQVEHPGGSAANVAVALSRLGREVRFASSWADDERGRAIATHLAGSGVVLAGDSVVLERTSAATAVLADDGSASYVFDLDWRLGPVPDLQPVVVHACSIGAVLQPGCRDVLALLDRHAGSAFVSYDVNARPAITGTGPDVVAATEAVARHADLVKASDEDLEALYPALTLAEAAAHLRSLGPRAVVVTRGGSGATWFADTEVSVQAPSVRVADTIGAGDTFSAAMLDALWDDPEAGLADPTEVLAHAARAAAVTVGRPGADPPYRHELG